MELIANLENSHSQRGLTPSNLMHLEKVFQETVGDKKEIDLENFKKIVQSKNMFFVERIFRIFDADNSGTVSLEEFMRVMWSFSRQSASEKLRYLFEVYDLNDDGSIQFAELRSVISECMKENGLTFSELEIDELTQMLFEDADTDQSGSINFNEFRDQLERHPAFLENITLSIERWLLPPMDQPQARHWKKPQKLRWSFIRNNWTSVTFLLVFLLLNFGLFISRAIEYRHSNGFVIIARACGQCLNFTCSFIVVLVLRQTLTWLRMHGFAQYLPIDQHLYYHKVTGWFIFIYSLLHTIMHVANFADMSRTLGEPLEKLLISTEYKIGWVGGAACLTGWIMLAILVIMIISSMPFVRRSGKFEVFYFLHLLSGAFWICLILHGPNFWKWFIVPAIFFLIETAIRINRNLSSSKKAYVQQGVLLPSKVTHLVIKRPPKFDYRPGDFVYINIPSIASYEWHPFTISSAPELDNVIWLHIRGVGEWTNSLYSFFDRQNKEAVLSDELVKSFEECPSSSNPPEVQDALSFQLNPVIAVKDIDGNSLKTKDKSSKNKKPLVEKSFSDSMAYTNSLLDSSTVDSTSELQTLNSSSHTVININSESTPTSKSEESLDMSIVPIRTPIRNSQRRTSFSSTSTSRAIQHKNKEDLRRILAEQNVGRRITSPSSQSSKVKRRSVRVSVADRGLRRCQTIIVMPTVNEDDDDEDTQNADKVKLPCTEEEVKDIEREQGIENVVVTAKPLRIFLDGPYGSPTRHIFQAQHAVLIATGIGVTPFASILQSIMYQYRKSRHTCPQCCHKWTDPLPVSSVHLKKVDFFWLNRNQRAFEWFVSLLSELEIEQAQLQEQDHFLDIHMFITSALDRTDMKAVGLQMALDLLYQKEKRCLITGLKSRTQPGRPDWNKVFTEISNQNRGKVTVFFCGPNQLAKTLHTKCDEFGFKFRKEIF